jgi:hypothetical protein
MEPLDEARCRRILDVAPDATMDEVDRAYHLLKRFHGRDLAVFAAPGMDELAADVRRDILEEIEAAYRHLTGLRPAAQAGPAAPPPPPEAAEEEPAGQTVLDRARRAAGLSLDHVAAETHVRREFLAALEAERFDNLRLATVNVRGYLTAFANAVGLAPDQVVPAYMARYQEWLAGHHQG